MEWEVPILDHLYVRAGILLFFSLLLKSIDLVEESFSLLSLDLEFFHRFPNSSEFLFDLLPCDVECLLLLMRGDAGPSFILGLRLRL